MNTSTSSVRETSVLENHALSELFCSPDADVTFISSNNILFKLHGTHLTTLTSTGFARASEYLSVSEPVRLPEHSTVLEILFQFIEPPTESRHFRQPSIVGLDSTVFFGVSEAAEKYVVYGAMNVCITRMQQIVVEYPLEVLNHCAKHGYPELGDEAAEHSLLADLSQVAVKLTVPGLLSQ